MSKQDKIKSQEEDTNAIKAIIAGDKSAFSVLEKKYRNIVASLIRKMIRDEDDVQDLTQETFIKAYNAMNTFQFGYTFSAWLYRIASNNCIDFLRKKRVVVLSLNQMTISSDDDEEIEIEDNSFLPDIKVLSDERKKALDDAINKLPDNYRTIIKLRHEEEMDYAEISSQLDLPLGTVKAHLFRARKILYDNLKKYKYLFQ